MANSIGLGNSSVKRSNFLRYSLRWAIVGYLFFLLITSCLAIWEVMAFQRTVKQIAQGNEQSAQRIFRAVDEAAKSVPKDADARQYSLGSDAIYYNLALTLDTVAAASRQLQNFSSLAPPRKLDAGEVFRANRKTLQQNWSNFQSGVNEVVPRIGLAKDIVQFLSAAKQFSTFRLAGDAKLIETGIDETAQDIKDLISKDTLDAQASFKSRQEELVRLLNRIEGGIGTDLSDSERDFVKLVKETAKSLADFSLPAWRVIETGQASVIPGNLQALAAADKEKDNTFAGLLASLNDVFEQAKNLPDMDTTTYQRAGQIEALSDAYIQFENDLSKSEPDTGTVLAGNGQESDEFLEKALSQVDSSVNTIREALKLRSSVFTSAGALSEQIVAVNEAVAHLKLLSTDDNTRFVGPGGEAQTGTDTRDELAELQNRFAQVTANFEQVVNERTVYGPIAETLRGNPDAQVLAQTIWNQYAFLDSFSWAKWATGSWLSNLSGIPYLGWLEDYDGLFSSFRSIATIGNESLVVMLVLMLGALGSLIFMTKDELQLITRRHEDQVSREMYPISWYLFRPVFGSVVALAIYLIYKTGQLALGGSGVAPFSGEVNVPILSVLALIAGLLAWQTLETIEARGTRWLGSFTRTPLYATGLGRALKDAGRAPGECGSQIGRTAGQVERWIAGADKVTPEMQDRIATWLDLPYQTLFTEKRRRSGEGPRRAVAEFREIVDGHDIFADRHALADRLGVTEERLDDWIDGTETVPVAYQWQLVDLLEVSHDRLFEPKPVLGEAWAVGLRSAMQKRKGQADDVQSLSDKLKVNASMVREWMELESPVPARHRAALARLLRLPDPTLFAAERPARDSFAYATGLRLAMEQESVDAQSLADLLDLDIEHVRDWVELDRTRGPVAKTTQRAIAQILNRQPSELFGSIDANIHLACPDAELRSALSSAIDNGQTPLLAMELDMDEDHVPQLNDEQRQIAVSTLQALKRALEKLNSRQNDQQDDQG